MRLTSDQLAVQLDGMRKVLGVEVVNFQERAHQAKHRTDLCVLLLQLRKQLSIHLANVFDIAEQFVHLLRRHERLLQCSERLDEQLLYVIECLQI